MQILSDIRVETDGQRSEKWAGKSLKLSTTDSSIKLPSKMAETGVGGEVSWKLTEDELRLPFYNKYSSALVFEVGAGGGIGPIGGGSDAIAALWLRDLEDDKETEVRIPLLAGDKLDTCVLPGLSSWVMAERKNRLRQNYVNDQTAKTHPYNVIGALRRVAFVPQRLELTPRLRSPRRQGQARLWSRRRSREIRNEYVPISTMGERGLIGSADAQNSRHAFEAFELSEGREARAEKISHFNDDGVIDKEEAKEIKKAKEKELHTRHRGNRQFAPVRTAIWVRSCTSNRLAVLTCGRARRARTE